MLTDLQKKTAAAIVNVFETGRVLGDYGALATLPGDTGHLSYGRSQVTLGSGSLYRLIQAYCNNSGAAFAVQLSGYLVRLQQRDFTLDTDTAFRALLRQAGQDSTMQTVQDKFFDANYWVPAALAASGIGISSALGTSVVYDSHVQGAWTILRDRTLAQFGAPRVLGENEWVNHYVNLIQASRYDLPLPILLRGISIDENSLSSTAAPRLLRLTTPPMTGDDVLALQKALVATGANLVVDGTFGPDTDTAVRQFQQRQAIDTDGIVGAATRSALGL